MLLPLLQNILLESSGADHDLLADDIESASEVTSPSIGQVHVLAANDVESASEVTSPALTTNTDQLLADDIESASEVSSPAIGQIHVLAANDVESSSEVSSPELDRPPFVSGGGGSSGPRWGSGKSVLRGLRFRADPLEEETEKEVEEIVEEVISEVDQVERDNPEIKVPGQDIAEVARKRAVKRDLVVQRLRKIENISKQVATRQIEQRINDLVRQRRAFFDNREQEDIRAILLILAELL